MRIATRGISRPSTLARTSDGYFTARCSLVAMPRTAALQHMSRTFRRRSTAACTATMTQSTLVSCKVWRRPAVSVLCTVKRHCWILISVPCCADGAADLKHIQRLCQLQLDAHGARFHDSPIRSFVGATPASDAVSVTFATTAPHTPPPATSQLAHAVITVATAPAAPTWAIVFVMNPPFRSGDDGERHRGFTAESQCTALWAMRG